MSRDAVPEGGENAASRPVDDAVSTPLSATALLGSQVVLGRIRLGSVRDVLFGADLGVVLGLAVETDAGRQCFLPWAGAHPSEDAVVVAAPTLVLGEVELQYYVASGIRLSDIIDVDLGTDGRALLVRDVTFDRDGSTGDLTVRAANGRMRRVAVGDVRVHWSTGGPTRLTLVEPRRRNRRSAAAGGLALARGRAA